MNAIGPAASPAPPAKVKCLVVDDLRDNLFTMAALLANDDVEVLTAQSGQEALELLLVNDVALALLDVQMPQMDGFELAEIMRSSERTRHVPLIFVTAGAREQRRLFKGYDSGAVDFLFKPVEPWILESKARIFFELHRSRQRLAQELRERTETLRLNETFSAILAHDLRDPLAVIASSASLIEQRSGDEAVRAAAERIHRNARGMSRMIGDLLDLSRARLAGGIPLSTSAVDLAPLVDRVADEQRALHPDRTVVATKRGDLGGRWDGDRLVQVLSNLVGNAAVHGTPGSAIAIDADGSDAADVQVTVASRGVIAADLLPHVFSPFRGRRREGEPGAGLGLGLYIVDQIVRSHGGTVEASSADGITTFRIVLPRHAAAATPSSPAAATPAAPAAPGGR